MKKGHASRGNELILLKANPAIASSGSPIAVSARIRDGKPKAMARGAPITKSKTSKAKQAIINKAIVVTSLSAPARFSAA
jgi:hypothetical protein